MEAWTRRELLARGGAVALVPSLVRAAVADGPVVGRPPLTDAQYLALADRIMRRLSHTWVRHRGAYSAGGLRVGVIYNAELLLVHAVAAQAGHSGRARNDARARELVARLCESPPFFDGRWRAGAGKMFHAPGWMADLHSFDSMQDKSIDPKVAEALTAAWRAREALGLSSGTVVRLTRCIDRVARGRFFRYPSVRLNQFNWNAGLYACAALVTGDPELLRDDYRRQLRRFISGVRRPLNEGGTTNLGPTYRFHYLPHFPSGDRSNLDSAEYANITLCALAAYEPALAVGMEPLPAGDMAILRAWVRRALFGYWMHNGMLSWDTGLGLARWMKAKTWAYAQQGLLAIARAERFHDDPAYGPWAKHLFDRGLGLYETMLVEGQTRAYPSPHLYGTTTIHQGVGDERMFSARMAGNAARAVTAGLGRMPAPEPPPFYAFDADIGRLAVSTPSYGTAIVSDNRGAFPYGGVELARLFDAAGRPVGGLGGRGSAGFGIVVRAAGRTSRTQSPRAGQALSLVRSPGGRVDGKQRPPRRAEAGPFAQLETIAQTTGHDATVTTRYRFLADAIEVTWTIRRRTDAIVEAQFPSGARDAAVDAYRGDGRVTRLRPGGPATSLNGIARLEIGTSSARYTVTLPALHGGTARAIRPGSQATAPHPGPTLVVRVPPTSPVIRAQIRPAR